jgi:hypothetical protein
MMNFIPPAEYIRLWRKGVREDFALVSVPIGTRSEECIAYLLQEFCGFLKSPYGAVVTLLALGDLAPKTGRVVHATIDGELVYATGENIKVAFIESFGKDDVLYCSRSWVYAADAEDLPKGPFTGQCRVVIG